MWTQGGVDIGGCEHMRGVDLGRSMDTEWGVDIGRGMNTGRGRGKASNCSVGQVLASHTESVTGNFLGLF